MKMNKVLAMFLAVVMVLGTISTVAFAEITPPENSKVRVTEKTVTQTFSEAQEKVWDIWDTQGSFGSYTTTGDALNITGGTVPFVTLSGFGSNLKEVNEIVVEYKTNDKLKIQLRIREKGSSKEVELDPTGGEYAKVSILPSQFEGGALTAEDIKSFASTYDSETEKFTSTAMLYLTSSNASIKSLNAYWYSYTSESSVIRKTLEENFSKTTWGNWGKWTGGGSTQVPIEMEWIDGANEDGVSPALRIRGGNTGSGSYAGGQFAINNGFDLTAMDAFLIRYKSTSGIDVYLNRTYQVEKDEKLPASEVEVVKGILGDEYSTIFDADGKNISGKQWKKESKSSKFNLKSTGGEWMTETVPISKLGSAAWLKTVKTVIVNKSFIPCYQLRFEGCCYGDFATTEKEFYLGGFTGVWYDKLPTMASLAFVNGGEEVEALFPGKTDVKVTLNNPSDVAIEDSLILVGLYNGTQLIDVDVKSVDTPALGNSEEQILSVELPASVTDDNITEDYQLRVMLWDSASGMNQITNRAFIDCYGYIAEN